MIKWVTSKEVAEVTGLGLAMAKRTLQNRRYKKQPLTVRTEKSKKGKPAYFVLWDTETNQPATPGEEDHEQPVKPPEKPVDLPVPAAQPDTVALCRNTGGVASLQRPAPAQPRLQLQAQANALLLGKDMAIESTTAGAGTFGTASFGTAQDGLVPTESAAKAAPTQGTGTVDAGAEAPDFETLLHRKTINKSASCKRSTKAYYRKLYAETGEIPPALFVDEGRRFAGKKSSLDSAIQSRFIDMVIKSADATDIFNFYTHDQRKVSVFQGNLEKEFGCKIERNKLYALVRSCNLKPYLEMADDEEAVQKMPGFFKAEPVGGLVQIDGVEADYFEIFADGRWRKPVWIEFMDLGSRKLLAMHAYLSESSKNSVDIFTRFLTGNDFAHRQMNIRPDQAGGFRNLKRPIHELNQRYSVPDGFIFIDDFARAGTPKDKAHLESSHRAVHKNLERSLINHFKDKVDSQYQKQKKTGNNLKTVTVTRLNISLEDLNDSGLTEAYMSRHNGLRHRFREDGTERSWVPDERWNAHLAASRTFTFKPEDVELCKRYGYEKAKASIGKDGCITHAKRKYYVEDKSLWSRQSPTRVKISLIDDHLALFKDCDDGEYLGDANALQAPVKPAGIIAREKEKVEKIHTENEFFTIVKALEGYGMIIDKGNNEGKGKLQMMMSDGLTLEIIRELLAGQEEKLATYAGTFAGFNLLASKFKRYLSVNKPPRLIPYAGAPSDDGDKK